MRFAKMTASFTVSSTVMGDATIKRLCVLPSVIVRPELHARRQGFKFLYEGSIGVEGYDFEEALSNLRIEYGLARQESKGLPELFLKPYE